MDEKLPLQLSAGEEPPSYGSLYTDSSPSQQSGKQASKRASKQSVLLASIPLWDWPCKKYMIAYSYIQACMRIGDQTNTV